MLFNGNRFRHTASSGTENGTEDAVWRNEDAVWQNRFPLNYINAC